MPSPIFGPVVGFGEANNSNSVVVTLTANVPKSSDTVTRGLVAVIATIETPPDVTYGGDPTYRPVITDNSTPGPPYAGMSNYLQGTNMIWNSDDNASLPVVSDPGPYPSGDFGRLRGFYPYVVVTTLNAGHQVTVDFSSVLPHTLKWIGVHLHTVENPSAFYSAYKSTGYGYHQAPAHLSYFYHLNITTFLTFNLNTPPAPYIVVIKEVPPPYTRLADPTTRYRLQSSTPHLRLYYGIYEWGETHYTTAEVDFSAYVAPDGIYAGVGNNVIAGNSTGIPYVPMTLVSMRRIVS